MIVATVIFGKVIRMVVSLEKVIAIIVSKTKSQLVNVMIVLMGEPVYVSDGVPEKF
jgi:hypothetical protein